MALQYITKDILKRDPTSGEALLDLPYDTAFIAGYDSAMVAADVVAQQRYGKIGMVRSGEFIGEGGYIETQATGSALICDIEKNGVSIYSTKPQFNATENILTAGVLSTTTFVADDRISFKVTQVGSTVAGAGVCFTLKCRV